MMVDYDAMVSNYQALLADYNRVAEDTRTILACTDHGSSDSDRWEAVPVPVLFGLLLVVFVGFVVFPAADTGIAGDYADRWTKVSPFVSLYDVLERVTATLCSGRDADVEAQRATEKGADGTDAGQRPSTSIRPNASWGALALRLLAVSSLLALLTFRNAPWTQCCGFLYFLQWLISFLPSPPGQALSDQSPARPDYSSPGCKIRRFTALQLSTVCHVAVYSTATSGPRPTSSIPLGLVNGVVFTIVSVAVDLNERRSSPVLDHDFEALATQFLNLGFPGLALWLFAFSPSAMPRKTVFCDATEWEKLVHCMTPLLWLHLGTISLCLGRRSLRLSSPWVKVLVAGMWIAVGEFYCGVCQVLYVGFGEELQMPNMRTMGSLGRDWGQLP